MKALEVLDPQTRKELCSNSRVPFISKMACFNRDKCPLRGFMVTRIDQDLQRAHNLKVRMQFVFNLTFMADDTIADKKS